MNKNPIIFLSYSHSDEQKATELASRLRDAGLECFVAGRDITATQQWEPRIREALLGAQCVMLLLTPRSINSNWVMIEAGAAWALEKVIVPATMFVEAGQLVEPIRRFQGRPVETDSQVVTLIQELQEKLRKEGMPDEEKGVSNDTDRRIAGILAPAAEYRHESFCLREDWDQLQKIGDWKIDDHSGVFQGEGVNQYLLSHFPYGEGGFHIAARLRFTSLQPKNDIASVNAGIVFGWKSTGNVIRYFNLLFTGKKVLLELVGDKGGPVFSDYKHIDEGVEFKIEHAHYYTLDVVVRNNCLNLKIDNQDVYSMAFHESPVGRVGLRPWRSRLDSDRFDVKEIA